MKNLTWYQEGGINWCWWTVTETRENGEVHLVGHFRERWEWEPPEGSVRGKGHICEAHADEVKNNGWPVRTCVGITTWGQYGGLPQCDVAIFANPLPPFDQTISEFGKEYRPQ